MTNPTFHTLCTELVMHFRGVPLIPPPDCTDPQSWIAEQIYQMGAATAEHEQVVLMDDALRRMAADITEELK